MKNFCLHLPTKILFGRDTITAIGAETAAFGKRVLLLHGREAIRKNGIHRTVMDSLLRSGCEVIEFGGVQPNPTLSKVREASQVLRRSACDVICAVGGGSVIDSAKAISCAIPAEHDVWKFFTGRKSIAAALPLTCVTTVAGSGSDCNSGMVITNEDKKVKFGHGSRFLYPKVSVLDPEATFTVPEDQTAYGAIDTLCHLLEIFCNNSLAHAPLQEAVIAGLMEGVMQQTPIAQRQPMNYEARAQLLWAASLSLSGLCSSGLGRIGMPMHLMEHSISALHGTVHGAGLAVLMPAWLQYQARRQPEKIARLGRRIFGLREGEDGSVAVETAQNFREWLLHVRAPLTLRQLLQEPADLPAIAANTAYLAKIWRLQQYDPQTVADILRLCQ